VSVQQSHLLCPWEVADDGVWKPLTALHGHLEALAGEVAPDSGRRSAVLQATLPQSRKVIRLSQQLFELATLYTSAPPKRPP